MNRNAISSTLIALSLSFSGVCFAQSEQGDTVPTESYATNSAPQWAYASKNINLRAGPSTEYPIVVTLMAGSTVSVQGCLSDYVWCDVISEPYRGWVYAGNLTYQYQGSPVPVASYGAVIGIGILGFSIANYWDRYYRGSPWYPQRNYWIGRPQPYHPPGGYRPPPRPGYGPSGAYRPSQGQGPSGGQRPPQGQGPSGGQRRPQGQGPGGGQRPPQGQRPSGGQRPPQGQEPSGAQKSYQHEGR